MAAANDEFVEVPQEEKKSRPGQGNRDATKSQDRQRKP
jgi:hypothetical protein